MKLGMPELFEYSNIEDNFKLAKKLDLDFIEFNLNFSSCREALENGSLKQLADQYKLEVTLHFYDEADFGSYDEVVKAYLGLLDKYASLGKGFVKQINVHLIPGPVVTIAGIKHYVYEKEYDAFIKRLVKNLKEAQAICNKYEINMVIENTDNIPNYVKKVYLDLYKEGFRFCYDIGHDHLSNDIVLGVLSDTNLPFDEFHIHDAKNRSTCHLALKEGTLDISKYKSLAENSNAYVVLEVKQVSDLVKSVPIFKKL